MVAKNTYLTIFFKNPEKKEKKKNWPGSRGKA
jgi:hypothetical protein